MALFQHPLYAKKDKLTSRTTFTSDTTGHAPTSNASGSEPPPPDLSVSDLRIGRVLEIPQQLKDVILRIRSLEDGTAHEEAEGYDRSTALLVMSCYTRLETLYSRTTAVLRRVRSGDQRLKDIHLLMPGLVIDGFSISKSYDLQLSCVIYLYDQAHERIRTCIKGASKIPLPD